MTGKAKAIDTTERRMKALGVRRLVRSWFWIPRKAGELAEGIVVRTSDGDAFFRYVLRMGRGTVMRHEFTFADFG